MTESTPPSIPVAPIPSRTSGLAIASLVCAFVFPFGIPSIICGHIARSQIKKSQGGLTGAGLALAGLILGYLSLLVMIPTMIAVLFFASRAYVKESNRETCIINIKTVQKAVRGYQTFESLEVGSPISEKDIVGPDEFLDAMPTCPVDGSSYIWFSQIPDTGKPVISCPHAGDMNHQPQDTTGW